MNIAIQTKEEELVCLITSSMDRAKEILQKSNVEYSDIYEVKDDEMQYYCFDDKIFDPKFIQSKVTF